MSKVFADRLDAGRRLATALSAYRGRNPLVLAIPRGAVAMGAEIAKLLGGELDVVLVKKLHDESGWTFVAAVFDSSAGTTLYVEDQVYTGAATHNASHFFMRTPPSE